MTKVRPPLTIDAALARIAGQLPGGWREMAELTGRQERTARGWGDHREPADIPVACAIVLDIAYRKAGGEGRPLFDVYRLKLDIAEAAEFADNICHARDAMSLAGEAADAVKALIARSLPGSHERDRETCIRELEDVSRVVTAAIANLRPP